MTRRKQTKRGSTSGGKRASTSRAGRSSRASVDPAAGRVRVAVFESAKSHVERARSSVTGLGYQLLPETEAADIVTCIASDAPPDVVLVGDPGGDEVLAACRDRTDGRPVSILALAGPAASAGQRCAEAGADLYALRPHSRDSLAPPLHAARGLIAERQRLDELRATEEILRARLRRYGEADAATGLQHFDFFRQLLIMELKRAKRYRYSLAACLVALDPWPADHPEPSPEAARLVRTRVASAIVSCIRDIDIPVEFADDRFLAFLPYTDLAGAEQVGRRIAAAVKKSGGVRVAGDEIAQTVSVGISALRPGKPVSFARLMRDASAAVRAAQLKGGGRVVVRR